MSISEREVEAAEINLDLPRKLLNKQYRDDFFRAECAARVARQLIDLRKQRKLTQAQLAELVGTKQPAIAKAERADNQNRHFSVILQIAAALDARVTVTIEPVENILSEYDDVYSA